MTTDEFVPEAEVLAQQQAPEQAQAAPAPQGTETQAAPPTGGMALDFITATPPQPAAQPGQPEGAGLEQFRARMHVVPDDAAVIAYVNEHNRQNPSNPITLADASERVRFAKQEAPTQREPQQAQPPDFAARLQQTQQTLADLENKIAAATDAGDSKQVAQLLRESTRLEVDIREIQRNEQAWARYAQDSAAQAQTQALERAQETSYNALVRAHPDLGVANSPARIAFEAEWQAAAQAGDPTLTSPQAAESILGRVALKMGGIPQSQQPPQQFRPQQAHTWQPTVPGTASPTAMRNAPAFLTPDQIATKMRNGEVSVAELDAYLNARRAG